MSSSTLPKSRRRFPSRFSDMRIRTKLLAVIALIIIVFLMIVATVVVSFHRIENVLGGVISGDMNNVMTNALAERELSSIVADLNLLLGTFFQDEDHLNKEGERLIKATRVLARQVTGSGLEAPLGRSVRQMELLLLQCREVNLALRLVSAADQKIVSGLDSLDEVISDKLINAVLTGDDTTILQQLSVLVVGYRQSLLEIGKLHAQRWPETYYAPIDKAGDPLLAAIDELDLRLRPLIAGDRQIADLGNAVIKDLQTYKNGLLALNAVMIELKKRMLDVENARLQATDILKKLDRNVVQAVNAANTKVLRTLWVAETSLIVISLMLIAALIVLTTFFFKSIIRKPMDDICDGIKAFRRSNLNARIDLNRKDEWHLIEQALNAMAEDLSNSYADLKTAQSLVSNIIDSMPSVLVGVDGKGMVTQWNSRAEQVTGIPSETARSQPLDKVFPVLTREMNRIKTAIQERRVLRDSKVRREDREGDRYEDVTIFPLVANGVEGAVIRVDDVTEQVRLGEMMIQSEKMLSVGGLAAGMAHEINNPLAGMMQSASVMKSRLEDMTMPANLRAAEALGISMEDIRSFMEKRNIFRMLDAINESGLRAAEIVSSMLSFARKSDANMSSYYPDQLMDKIVELASIDYDLKKQYDFKAIEIVKEYDDGLPMLVCEGGKIQQVLLNILRNGVQAMQAAKTISPRFILRICNEKESGMVRIEVKDNGPGMDEKTRLKVFDPFFTTKPVGIGTGLGLSVSYFIITENHKGKMDVISEPGKGATFIIRLPVTTGEEMTPRQASGGGGGGSSPLS